MAEPLKLPRGDKGTWAVRGQAWGRRWAWRKPLGRRPAERGRAGAADRASPRGDAGARQEPVCRPPRLPEEGRAGWGGGEGEDGMTASDLQ